MIWELLNFLLSFRFHTCYRFGWKWFGRACLHHPYVSAWGVYPFVRQYDRAVGIWPESRRCLRAVAVSTFLLTLWGLCGYFEYDGAFVDPYVPGIGASGAIFGVMGAYLALFPEGRIRTLILIWIVPTWPRIRAFWVVLYFLGIQLIPAFLTFTGEAEFRVNYWAHIGGFLGALFIHLFLRPEAFARYLSDVSV